MSAPACSICVSLYLRATAETCGHKAQLSSFDRLNRSLAVHHRMNVLNRATAQGLRSAAYLLAQPICLTRQRSSSRLHVRLRERRFDALRLDVRDPCVRLLEQRAKLRSSTVASLITRVSSAPYCRRCRSARTLHSYGAVVHALVHVRMHTRCALDSRACAVGRALQPSRCGRPRLPRLPCEANKPSNHNTNAQRLRQTVAALAHTERSGV